MQKFHCNNKGTDKGICENQCQSCNQEYPPEGDMIEIDPHNEYLEVIAAKLSAAKNPYLHDKFSGSFMAKISMRQELPAARVVVQLLVSAVRSIMGEVYCEENIERTLKSMHLIPNKKL